MICKYFNVSFLEVENDLDLGDYYCMLAEALDAEELDLYERYLFAGGDKKKWKWASSDKAGTNKPATAVNTVQSTLEGVALSMFKSDAGTLKKRTARQGRAKEWADVTGRPWIYMNPDGVYLTKDIKPISPPFEFGTVIIKIDYDGNEI